MKAAQAYDLACIKLRGIVGSIPSLNFPLPQYNDKIDDIMVRKLCHVMLIDRVFLLFALKFGDIHPAPDVAPSPSHIRRPAVASAHSQPMNMDDFLAYIRESADALHPRLPGHPIPK